MTSIKVAVRVRPLSSEERRLSSKTSIKVRGNSVVVTDYKVPEHPKFDDHRLRERHFAFDYCFWSVDMRERHYASQEMVYDKLGTAVLDALLQGYNACLLSYGQTGSGKTFTMMGKPDQLGLTPRICQELFSRIQGQDTKNVSFQTDVSFMEIYNEKVYDLLCPAASYGSKPRLKVREHPVCGPFVEGLTTSAVSDTDTLMKLLTQGNDNRSLAATQVNDRSSRSHAIFTIRVTQAFLDQGRPSEVVSKLHLVDLAGSEKANPEFCQARIKEGGSINKSLVTLGNVISALAESTKGRKGSLGNKSSHIPYRDSLLTWLLRDSLGGNALTFMIATVSPSYLCFNETLNTLRYAERTKKIVNRPLVNEDPRTKLICSLKDEVCKLRELLDNSKLKIAFKNTCTESFLEAIVKENEEKVERWTQSWIDKWCEPFSLRAENSAMKDDLCWDETFCNEVSWPYLLHWDTNSPELGTTLYHLQEGETRVGSEATSSYNNIELMSPMVLPKHCKFINEKGYIRFEPGRGAWCTVNGAQVTEPVSLQHGDTIQLGQSSIFYLNHLFVSIRSRLNSEKGLSEDAQKNDECTHHERGNSSNNISQDTASHKVSSCDDDNKLDVFGHTVIHGSEPEIIKGQFQWTENKGLPKEAGKGLRSASFSFPSSGEFFPNSHISSDFDELHNCESLYLLDEALLNSSFGSVENDLTLPSFSMDTLQERKDTNRSIQRSSSITSRVSRKTQDINDVTGNDQSHLQKEIQNSRTVDDEDSLALQSENVSTKLRALLPSTSVLDDVLVTLKTHERDDNEELNSEDSKEQYKRFRSLSLPVGDHISGNTINSLKYSVSFPPCGHQLNYGVTTSGGSNGGEASHVESDRYNFTKMWLKDASSLDGKELPNSENQAPLILSRPNSKHEELFPNGKSGVPEGICSEIVAYFKESKNTSLADSLESNIELSSLNGPGLDLVLHTKDDVLTTDNISLFNQVNCHTSPYRNNVPSSILSENPVGKSTLFKSILSDLEKTEDDSIDVLDVSVDSIELLSENSVDTLAKKLADFHLFEQGTDSSRYCDDAHGEHTFTQSPKCQQLFVPSTTENNFTASSGANKTQDTNQRGFYLEITQSETTNEARKTSWSLVSQNSPRKDIIESVIERKDENKDSVNHISFHGDGEPFDSLEEFEALEESILREQEESESLLSRSAQEYHFFPYKNKEGKPVAGVLWKTDCISGNEYVSATIPCPVRSPEQEEGRCSQTSFVKPISPIRTSPSRVSRTDTEERRPSPNKGSLHETSSSESLESSTSSDSITYVFVGPSAGSNKNKRSQDCEETSVQDSQTESNAHNYPLEGFSASQRRPTYCSLSADSLDCRSERKVVSTCSPRTLSVDSLVLEEGLSRLQEDELTKFLNEWKEKTLRKQTWERVRESNADLQVKSRHKKGTPSAGHASELPSPESDRISLAESIKQRNGFVLPNTEGVRLSTFKEQKLLKKYGSAHSDPFPSIQLIRKVAPPCVEDLPFKNRSYPCHSTPKGGSLNFDEVTNCPLLPSIFENRTPQIPEPKDQVITSETQRYREMEEVPQIKKPEDMHSDDKLDHKIIDLLGNVVGIVGQILSKKSVNSSPETSKEWKQNGPSFASQCHQLEKSIEKQRHNICVEESPPMMLHNSSPAPNNRHHMHLNLGETSQNVGASKSFNSPNSETVTSMFAEVNKLRKERISFARMISDTTECHQSSSSDEQRKVTEGRIRETPKSCRIRRSRPTSRHSSNIPVNQRRGKMDVDDVYTPRYLGNDERATSSASGKRHKFHTQEQQMSSNQTAPHSPRHYIEHLLSIRRDTVGASSFLWKDEDSHESNSSCAVDSDLEDEMQTRIRSRRVRPTRRQSRNSCRAHLDYFRSISDMSTSAEHHSSSTSLDSKCDCDMMHINSLSSWNSRNLLCEGISTEPKQVARSSEVRIGLSNGDKENISKVCQISTDSGACCSSSPVSTTRELPDPVDSSALFANSRQNHRGSSHRDTHRDRIRVSKTTATSECPRWFRSHSGRKSENSLLKTRTTPVVPSTCSFQKNASGGFSDSNNDYFFSERYKPVVLPNSSASSAYQQRRSHFSYLDDSIDATRARIDERDMLCRVSEPVVKHSATVGDNIRGLRQTTHSRRRSSSRPSGNQNLYCSSTRGCSLDPVDAEDWFPSDSYRCLPSKISKDSCRHLIRN